MWKMYVTYQHLHRCFPSKLRANEQEETVRVPIVPNHSSLFGPNYAQKFSQQIDIPAEAKDFNLPSSRLLCTLTMTLKLSQVGCHKNHPETIRYLQDLPTLNYNIDIHESGLLL